MKHSILLKFVSFQIFILFAFSSQLKAQTSISGIVTDSLNKPVQFASVYLSKTTIGALTDNNGTYILSIPADGVYEMIISCIGYKTKSLIISASGNRQKINIKLSVNLVLLNEITVSSKDKNRSKNYAQFVKLFIGQTENSEFCRIQNPDDMHLYLDPLTNILNGYSLKPLKIENKALGYNLIYDISDFSFNPQTGNLQFAGYQLFQLQTGNTRRTQIWQHNRLIAYYGSRMHLLRALFNDSLLQENYVLFECKKDSATGELTITNPLPGSALKSLNQNNFMTLYFRNPLFIKYTNNHSELVSTMLGFTPQNYVSTILFTDTVKLYANSYYNKPYAVTWGGEMSNERVADMLPYDFMPFQVNKNELESKKVLSPVEKYLLAKQNTLTRDQVYVHTDRNMYKPGDTIHFQAYIRDRLTNVFETGSFSLYALLFNEEKKMIDSSRFRIEDALSSGWMAIPSTAAMGKYHFVAFTSAMQNFDPKDAFQIDLYVNAQETEHQKVDITFNKESYKPGDILEAVVKVTDDKGKSIDRQKIQTSLMTGSYSIETNSTRTDPNGGSVVRFTIPDTLTSQPELRVITKTGTNKRNVPEIVKIPFDDQYLDLRFLPEGGTLISGLEQRIGFNATNIQGESIFIEGLLKDSSGIVLDTIKSGGYGPGIFTCLVKPGMFVELTKGAGKEKKWSLPEPVNTGLSLMVSPVDNRSFAVEIQSNNYDGETVAVSGVMNLTQIFSQERKMTKKQRIIVETDQLPAGVVQITLFNKELNPVAERLYYINPDKYLKFDIKSVKDVYNSGQETELTISVSSAMGTPVPTYFSISVADSLSGHNAELFSPGIGYTFNYHPYFAANLPPKVLLEGLENLTEDQRDLLLMVYGWSKIKWDFKQEQPEPKELINYDMLKMRILYAAKSNRADRRLDLVSLEGPSIMHLRTNQTGEIDIPLDTLPKITHSVTMLPDTKNKKRVTGAMLSIPFNEQYFKSNKLFIQQPEIPTVSYNINALAPYVPGQAATLAKATANPSNSLIDKVIEMPEVIVTAQSRPPKIYHDKYEEKYQYADVRSLAPEQLWTASSLQDAIYRLIVPYAMTTEYIILNPSHSFFGGSVPALIVLDGMPLYQNGWDQVRMMSTDEVSSLTILKGNQAAYQYGMAAAGGAIFINTRSSDPSLIKLRTAWKLQNKKDKLLLPIYLYRQNIEYYNPSKATLAVDPMLQSRSTIFWDPEVYFDGKTPVKIKFTNLKHTGPVIITTNGVSVNNLVGTGKASYQVN